MSAGDETTYSLFEDERRLAHGALAVVSEAARAVLVRDPHARLMAFDDQSGRLADLDPREPQPAAPRKAGRPKLGVTAREVTLLPRHWDWLAEQPGGASVALRRLVEAARRDPAEQRRSARDGAYRFLSAMAGNLPRFEEASRALFADDREGFLGNTDGWPADIRGQALRMLGWG
jgi:hypothetical protein